MAFAALDMENKDLSSSSVHSLFALLYPSCQVPTGKIGCVCMKEQRNGGIKESKKMQG